jgi:hypothetical protein
VRRLIAILFALLASACATTTPVPPLQLPQPRLSPLAMGATLSLAQRLTVERAPAGRPVATRSLDTLLEVDTGSLRLAAFALGQRVLTMAWDGNSLTSERHPLLPAEVDAAYVLRDVQWMYGPLESLRQVLPSGWQLDERGGERILSHGAQPILLIHYESESRWTGRSRMENRLEGYTLTIESAQQAGG